MYLLVFEVRAFLAGKSSRVHRQSFERASIGTEADLSHMKVSTAEKSQRQTGNNNFRNKG